MRFSQSSFIYYNHSLQDAIRRLHHQGYDGIEIWGGRPHCYRHDLDRELDAIRRLLAELGMTVSNFLPAMFRYPAILCSLNETVRSDSVAYLQDAIDNAQKLGSPYLSFCPGMSLHGEDLDAAWAQLRRSICELLDYARGTGVTLLIEPAHRFESNLILTVEDGKRMIREVASERGTSDLGILFDTGHARVNGEDLGAVVRGLEGFPFHIHIDDNDGDSDTHLIPGQGSIDYHPLILALEDIGYQGFVSAELGFQYTADPDPAVEQTMVAFQSMFAG